MLLTGDVVRLGTMNGFDASARWLVPKIEEESGVLVSERDRWRVVEWPGSAPITHPATDLRTVPKRCERLRSHRAVIDELLLAYLRPESVQPIERFMDGIGVGDHPDCP